MRCTWRWPLARAGRTWTYCWRTARGAARCFWVPTEGCLQRAKGRACAEVTFVVVAGCVGVCCPPWGCCISCACARCGRRGAACAAGLLLERRRRGVATPPCRRRARAVPCPVRSAVRYLEGLEFIRGLPRQQAATVLPKYGKVRATGGRVGLPARSHAAPTPGPAQPCCRPRPAALSRLHRTRPARLQPWRRSQARAEVTPTLPAEVTPTHSHLGHHH